MKSEPIQYLRSCGTRTTRQEALAGLFEEHRRRLRAVIDLRLHHRLRRRVDPSDVLQQAFIEISRRLEKYLAEPGMPFYLWLRRVTLYTLRDVHRFHLNARARDARRDVEWEGEHDPEATTGAMAARVVDSRESAGTKREREERRAHVEEALALLGERDREVLALRFFEQLSNPEAAKILGITEMACRKRYFRALQRFREVFGDALTSEE